MQTTVPAEHVAARVPVAGMAKVNGIKISYKVEGIGLPLVMIAGINTNKGSWKPQTRVFKKYYCVITFDNRGAGQSDKPEGPYTIKMMADDTIGLMDHLNIQSADILGYSMGGMIAQELAINHPERVRKLVLASTWARMGETSGRSDELARAMQEFEKSSHDVASRRRFASAFLDLAINKRSNRVFYLPILKALIRIAPVSMLGSDGQADAAGAHDAADRLNMIKAPTLVTCGTEDRLIKPSSSYLIASLVPNAKLVKVPGGGHSFASEMSGEFNRVVLDFLRN